MKFCKSFSDDAKETKNGKKNNVTVPGGIVYHKRCATHYLTFS